MEDTNPDSAEIKEKDESNNLTRSEEIEDTSKHNEIRGYSNNNILQINQNLSSENKKSSDQDSLGSSTDMKPTDKILRSYSNLNIADIVDDKKSNMIEFTSSTTEGKEETYTDSDLRTHLQQVDLDSDDFSDEHNEHVDDDSDLRTQLQQLDLDCDDFSDEHNEHVEDDSDLRTQLLDLDCDHFSDEYNDHVDYEMSDDDIGETDDASEEDPENDEEIKDFNNSQFSQVLDKFMRSDKENIDLEAKIKNNIKKTQDYFCRKFIIDAMDEEREIEMEKLPSFIYETAGVHPENYTNFEKIFYETISVSTDTIKESIEKFKQRMANEVDTSMIKPIEVENYDTDNTKNIIDNLKEVMKKNDIYLFNDNMKNRNKNNMLLYSKTLLSAVSLSYECTENHILDHVLKELLKLKEIHRKYFAFCLALQMNDVDLVEKIYYHYSGNLHWLGTEATDIKNYQQNVVWNLKLLQILLCNARTNTNLNQETLYYLDSLISFNSFQVTLYTNLALSRKQFFSSDESSDKTQTQIEALKDIVLKILKIYKFYVSEKEIKEIHIQVPICMRDVLEDNALYFNYVDNLVRELYFKRIDLNVCLILLDNLNLLEERLLMPDGLYKKVKSSLYHFIYHLSKDWNTFLPEENKEPLEIPCKIDNGHSEEVVYRLDLVKLSVSPLIYLERKQLYNCLNIFKDELENIEIKSNIREKSNKSSKDSHSLNIVPYVTDEVSLEKMLYYMDGLSEVDLKNDRRNGQLIILRIIQVLGEFVKDSDESAHLSKETEFFLQSEVDYKIIKVLKRIRNNITHITAAQLVAKIDAEQNEKNTELFSDVFIELKEIKCGILKFLKNHRLRAKKASLKNALNLLRKRLEIVSNLKYESQSQPNVNEIEENGYLKQIWRKNISSEQFSEEMKFLDGNIGNLILSLKETTIKLRSRVLKKLPIYIQEIQDALFYISKRDKHNADNIDENGQWSVIKEILRFIIIDADIFEYHPLEVKKSRFSSLFLYFLTMTSNNDKIECVNSIILIIIECSEMYGSGKILLKETVLCDSGTTHSGLTKLNEILNRSNFLTLIEQKVILDNISKITESCNDLKDKINRNEPISKNKLDILLKNITLNNKSESHISNLVLGKKRCLCLLECLSDRVSLLKEVLSTHCNDVDKQHLIFLKNQKFRFIVEALLLDIMNIFSDTNQKKYLRKTSKFLAEVNLRNVLSHGNPLLELAGDVIDAKDLPVELMTKAMRYALDENAIKAVAILIRRNIEPNDIKNENKMLSKDLQNLIKEFKKSQHWQEYLMLAYKDYDRVNTECFNFNRQSSIINQKANLNKCAKKHKDSETSTDNELLQAVKASNLGEVKELVKTVANTNARDSSGKTCLHYAAMKGRADMIEVLVPNSVDIRCERDGRSALHYAAMNGHTAAVRALLAAGADVTATDRRGKTPRDYAMDDVMRTILTNTT